MSKATGWWRNGNQGELPQEIDYEERHYPLKMEAAGKSGAR
ncbi:MULTISPECIES: hypothetical protein [Chelativorans]|jgi:hypothetical protein|nr:MULTISPECIES: hypothetical protein [Chelativorans]